KVEACDAGAVEPSALDGDQAIADQHRLAAKRVFCGREGCGPSDNWDGQNHAACPAAHCSYLDDAERCRPVEGGGVLGMTVEMLQERYGHHHPDFKVDVARAVAMSPGQDRDRLTPILSALAEIVGWSTRPRRRRWTRPTSSRKQLRR